MSLETIRQLASKRFADFQGLPNSAKFYPNQKDPAMPKTGIVAKIRIVPVLRYVASIGSEPCTRRGGSIVIELYAPLDSGTAAISRLADELERWFSFYQKGGLWCDAGKTYLDGRFEPLDGDSQLSTTKTVAYVARVYIPFEYDEN